MRYTVTADTAPTSPVTTAEAKAWLDIDHSSDDSVVEAILQALTERVEEETGLSLDNRAWTYTAQSPGIFTIMHVTLPRDPVTAVASVTHIDGEGTEEVLTAGDDYYVLGSRIRFPGGLGMTSGARLVIEFTAGYATADDVPAPIKLAMRRACKTHYDIPLDQVLGLMVTRLPQPALDMLTPYRKVTV